MADSAFVRYMEVDEQHSSGENGVRQSLPSSLPRILLISSTCSTPVTLPGQVEQDEQYYNRSRILLCSVCTLSVFF
ncbi:hypothetical protein CIPAW_06G107000 [Carya illinoinensis]|uniref:Uncharacterized protein n=1 Tax=Carya illinoinensis TaxID=32201 RepID=A0A8T1QAL0_CARIL|nr:hypothetical protein CIPAW_06G107000 [Carya illinoinensis]